MVAPYRVIARNNAVASSNRMHDDSVARGLGFRGGLVPGADVWAYMAHPVLERWGRTWLERGSMEVRFQAPFYGGDTVDVDLEPDPARADAVVLRALNAAGEVCATGRATRCDDTPPRAAREHFESHRLLGTLESPWSTDLAAARPPSTGRAEWPDRPLLLSPTV